MFNKLRLIRSKNTAALVTIFRLGTRKRDSSSLRLRKAGPRNDGTKSPLVIGYSLAGLVEAFLDFYVDTERAVLIAQRDD